MDKYRGQRYTDTVSEIVSIRIPKGEIAPDIGIADKNREAVVQNLSKLLADEYALYTKTRKYPWNVTGPRFHQLHEFFKAQYEQLDGTVDDVAERIPQLGGKAVATMEEFLKLSRVREDAGQYPMQTRCCPTCLPIMKPS